MELPEIFEGEKTIAAVGQWIKRDPEQKSGLLSSLSELEIEGVSIPGLRLRATCRRGFPDRAVTFQLEYQRPRQRTNPLSRIEWRPLNRHNNKGIGPEEYRFKQILDSHIHPFGLNWRDDLKQLRSRNLPIAIPIDLAIRDFPSLLDFVGKTFRIKNISLVPMPEWERPSFPP